MIPALILQSSVRFEYDWLFWSMVALCTLVGTGIAAFLVYSAWRYRRKDPNELPPQIKNYIPVEVAWIGVPFLLFMAMYYAGVRLYFEIERPPDDAEDVYVVAKQWMWKLQHRNGVREINMLHVPVGRAIRLNMISQDAIHSFFVPAFRIKQDVLPRRYTTIWFRATQPGRYHLYCAEYCGANHSQMTGWVVAMDPHDYQRWLEQGGAEGSLASTGGKLFHQFGCANCHHFTGHGPCPNLQGVFGQTVRLAGGDTVVADETYIRESILNPRAKVVAGFNPIMPTFQGQISDEQVVALIAFIKALGPQPGVYPAEPSQTTESAGSDAGAGGSTGGTIP